MPHSLSIAQLRYTKTQFEALNPTPSDGQLCIETDTGVVSLGNGSGAYLTIRGNYSLTGEELRSANDVYASDALQPNPPKTYRALVTQSSDDAPVSVVLDNTTGATPQWQRADVGTYNLVAAGCFVANKTWWSPVGGDIPGGTYTFQVFRLDDDTMQLLTFDSGTPSDELVAEPLPIEILIYP